MERPRRAWWYVGGILGSLGEDLDLGGGGKGWTALEGGRPGPWKRRRVWRKGERAEWSRDVNSTSNPSHQHPIPIRRERRNVPWTAISSTIITANPSPSPALHSISIFPVIAPPATKSGVFPFPAVRGEEGLANLRASLTLGWEEEAFIGS